MQKVNFTTFSAFWMASSNLQFFENLQMWIFSSNCIGILQYHLIDFSHLLKLPRGLQTKEPSKMEKQSPKAGQSVDHC